MKRMLFPLAIIVICVAAAPASAQTIGTFRWNLAPFCSVLNLTITQQGSSFALTGYEEQCNNNPRLPVNGTAVVQADGTITLAVTTVFPMAEVIHTYVTLDTTVNGTWQDSATNTGTFVFNPTTATGEPRTPPSLQPDGVTTTPSAPQGPPFPSALQGTPLLSAPQGTALPTRRNPDR